MPNVMIIQGKVENIWDDEDFARMLRDKLGDDAERYFREHSNLDYALRDVTDEQILQYCTGECSKVEEAIEHWTGVLGAMKDELESIQANIAIRTKDETSILLLQLIQKINSEL